MTDKGPMSSTYKELILSRRAITQQKNAQSVWTHRAGGNDNGWQTCAMVSELSRLKKRKPKLRGVFHCDTNDQ